MSEDILFVINVEGGAKLCHVTEDVLEGSTAKTECSCENYR